MELEGKFPGQWQIFIGRFNNRLRRFQRNTLRQIQKIKAVNLKLFPTPLKKVSRTSSEQLSARLSGQHFILCVHWIFLKKFSKKALFKFNFQRRAEKLSFWQTFFVRFVIAEFHGSRRPLKKHFGKKRWVLRSWLTKTFSEFGKLFCAVVETEVNLSRRYLDILQELKLFISKHLDNHIPNLSDSFLILCGRFSSELS